MFAVEILNSQIMDEINLNKNFNLFILNSKKCVDSFNKKFGIWGLSFKPGTDDMREAPSISLITSIIKSGGEVNCYDPKATEEAKIYLKDFNINYFKDKYSTIKNVDALILVTEWKEFRSPDFDLVSKLMRGNSIFDGRNQFNKDFLNQKGFEYFQIGVKG